MYFDHSTHALDPGSNEETSPARLCACKDSRKLARTSQGGSLLQRSDRITMVSLGGAWGREQVWRWGGMAMELVRCEGEYAG